MPEHDVGQIASSLSAKMASRSRHVCLLLGAGASRACGLPDVSQLQRLVAEDLRGEDRTHFDQLITKRNLEEVLSRVRRIAALLEDESERVDGMRASDAHQLDAAICQAIVKHLAVDEANARPSLDLATWIASTDYNLPVEIFTVNYDILIESALEGLRVPYFDGFAGSMRAKFRTELVEARPGDKYWLPSFLVRLWKLHGSINWTWHEPDREVLRLGSIPENKAIAAIYPSDAKYDESRRLPFLVLQDRLRRSLGESETLLLISGFSFSDSHINEIIFDAARFHPRSEFIVFCYGDIPETLANRATYTPNLQAIGDSDGIIGGRRDKLSGPDRPIPEVWDGSRFQLGDFAHLAKYLSRSSTLSDGINDVTMQIIQHRGEPG